MARHKYKMSKKHRDAISRGVRRARRAKKTRGGKGKYDRTRARKHRGGGGGGYVRCSICHKGFIGGAKAIATHKKRRHRGKGKKRSKNKKRKSGSKKRGKSRGDKKRYYRFDMWAAVGQEEARRQKLAREADRRAANVVRLRALNERRRSARALGKVDWDVIAKAETARRAAPPEEAPISS